jgi:HNH endonuclease
MSRYISEAIRSLVVTRANGRCEYCLLHQDDAVFNHEIEHIISLKHGGSSDPDNLAWACAFCNRNKGTDIGTLLLPSQDFTRLFNPRMDIWVHHFQLNQGEIMPLTPIGQATVKVLAINHFERIIERRELMRDGLYPRE